MICAEVVMKLDINSEAWKHIYSGFRKHFYQDQSGHTRSDMERFLLSQGVKIDKDPGDGRWQGVEINLPEDELTLFLLRWS
jgi:hypothetical protein